MRKEGASNLLRLAFEMRGSRLGLSIPDIQERFGVSRRTAERMRAALNEVMPQMEEVSLGETPKRWRIPPSNLDQLLTVAADDLRALENASEILDSHHLDQDAHVLRMLAGRLRASLKPETLRKIEPDLEALTEAEGFALRCGPRPMIDARIMKALRTAILGCRKVRLHYRSRETGDLSRQIVCPYGFLYGARHYLVAFSMNPRIRDYRMYSLANIEAADVTEWSFIRRGFSMKNYAERSFGVFQEEPFKTVWRFHSDVAEDARTFLFHPSQGCEDQPDGSLIVTFTAGGATEMCWHLFTWGEHVEVLEPQWLAEKYRLMLAMAQRPGK
jgi:predicted DNA-binding transcriptional regulator YafY